MLFQQLLCFKDVITLLFHRWLTTCYKVVEVGCNFSMGRGGRVSNCSKWISQAGSNPYPNPNPHPSPHPSHNPNPSLNLKRNPNVESLLSEVCTLARPTSLIRPLALQLNPMSNSCGTFSYFWCIQLSVSKEVLTFRRLSLPLRPSKNTGRSQQAGKLVIVLQLRTL